MEIFQGQNLLEFAERFKSDSDCAFYLASLKWSNGYTCRKCGHDKCQVRKNHSRCCNKCSDIESPIVDTLFHRVRFGLLKAFYICFEMSNSTKSISATQMGLRVGITEKTARIFMHKVREAMKSSENFPMDGTVHVDEFVVGGKEQDKLGRSYDSKKKKAVTAVQLTDKGKVRRIYIQKIKDFSAKSLQYIFLKHIDQEAVVVTDKWRGYKPIAKKWNITQKDSDKGKNFIALHTMIHQVKSWIRTIYSWVSDFHIQRYYDEFCYRINRSQSKDTRFNNLIKRMIKAQKVKMTDLVSS